MTVVTYVHEKFHNAVEALATNDGPLHERLIGAYTAIVALSPEDMPNEQMRVSFAKLMDDLTATKDEIGDKGHVRLTLEAADELELRDLAQAFVDLHEASILAAHAS